MSRDDKSNKKESKADTTRQLNSEEGLPTQRNQSNNANHRPQSTPIPPEIDYLNFSFNIPNDGPDDSSPRRNRRSRSSSRRRERNRSRSRSRNTGTQQTTPNLNNFTGLMEAILNRVCVAGQIQADIVFHNHPDEPEEDVFDVIIVDTLPGE